MFSQLINEEKYIISQCTGYQLCERLAFHVTSRILFLIADIDWWAHGVFTALQGMRFTVS